MATKTMTVLEDVTLELPLSELASDSIPSEWTVPSSRRNSLFCACSFPKTGIHPASSAGQAFSGSCFEAQWSDDAADAIEEDLRERTERPVPQRNDSDRPRGAGQLNGQRLEKGVRVEHPQ